MCQPWEISNRMQCVSCYYYLKNYIASSIRNVWLELDTEMSLRPNALGSPDKLEDLYFFPKVTKIQVKHLI